MVVTIPHRLIVFPVDMVHPSPLSPASLTWLHAVSGRSLGCECLFFAALSWWDGDPVLHPLI